VRFEIDRGSLQPGQTLVIYTRDPGSGQLGQHAREPASALAMSNVDGKVADCDVVPATGAAGE
jgi:hypothetical protein